MRLTAPGFADLTAVVMDIARRHAEQRLVLVLEGGYDLNALAASVTACVARLGDDAAPPPPLAPSAALSPVIEAHIRHLP
jgi:acetoin utilization deacetylase AcuC-like enzyme